MRLGRLHEESRRWVPLCNPRAGRFFPLSSPVSGRATRVWVAYLHEEREESTHIRQVLTVDSSTNSTECAYKVNS
jgi:hypothetical protein